MAAKRRANVYVDGFNLYYGALRGSPYKWLDLEALARRVQPGDQINRVRYFSARIKARPDSDPQSPVRQQTYLRALESLPSTSVHLGHFLVTYPRMPLRYPPPRTAEVIKTEEKGSDVNLATYLMLDACRQECDVVVLISNDSDLAEPLRIARVELGLTTVVVNPQPAAIRSRALIADDFWQLRSPALAACQLPPRVVDRAGRVVHKPAAW